MKTKLLYFFIVALLFCGCNRSSDLAVFIPGTYVSQVKGDYSESFDTLIIGSLNERNSSYQILRKSGFRRLEAGKMGKPEHALEEWLGIWDKESVSIQVPKNSKIIRFFPDSALLLLGSREFRKLQGD